MTGKGGEGKEDKRIGKCLNDEMRFDQRPICGWMFWVQEGFFFSVMCKGPQVETYLYTCTIAKQSRGW